MLRTLIVDDELYVRQEMRRLGAWEKYGISISGEAENGDAALDFLEKNPVDLLFTDLSMPGLSGMEYLREVRRRFPGLHIAILTMHRDFDLIQEAMRLGVDDYITKEQFDRNTVDGILKSMLKRIGNGELCAGDRVSCLYFPAGSGEGLESKNAGTSFKWLDEFFALTDGAAPAAAFRIDVEGVNGLSYRELLRALHAWAAEEFFYICDPSKRHYSFCVERNEKNTGDKKAAAGEERARLEKTTAGARWILDVRLFDEILKKIPQTRMNREQLTAFFYRPVFLAREILGIEAAEYFAKVQDLRWWYQWKDWLLSLHRGLEDYMDSDQAAAQMILNALSFIREHCAENLKVEDALKAAAMSKSHFSAAFKEVTGRTFVDYVKQARIEKAKKLLTETGRPINLIGEDVGYPDTRYFRRVFLEITGVSPARWRKDAGVAAPAFLQNTFGEAGCKSGNRL